MAVTGVWLGPGIGMTGALAAGVAAAAVSPPAGVASAGTLTSVDALAEPVAGGAPPNTGAAAAASAAAGSGSDFAIEVIATCEGGTGETTASFLIKGFLTAGIAGFAAGLAGAIATFVAALTGSGGGKEMLRVTKAGTRLDAASCAGPKRLGGWRSTSPCASSTSAASAPSVRQRGAARDPGESAPNARVEEADTRVILPAPLRRHTAHRESAGL